MSCHDMNLKLVLNNLRSEVAVHFVDIRGIADSSYYLWNIYISVDAYTRACVSYHGFFDKGLLLTV